MGVHQRAVVEDACSHAETGSEAKRTRRLVLIITIVCSLLVAIQRGRTRSTTTLQTCHRACNALALCYRTPVCLRHCRSHLQPACTLGCRASSPTDAWQRTSMNSGWQLKVSPSPASLPLVAGEPFCLPRLHPEAGRLSPGKRK